MVVVIDVTILSLGVRRIYTTPMPWYYDTIGVLCNLSVDLIVSWGKDNLIYSTSLFLKLAFSSYTLSTLGNPMCESVVVAHHSG